VIAVSESTKKEILRHFDVPAAGVVVTHEGIDETLTRMKPGKRPVKDPYFLYVGNVYPHKNIDVLLRAFAKVSDRAKLVLVGKDDFFYRRLRHTPAFMTLGDRIEIISKSTDSQLANLYRHAEALVFPSRMEGFGLPAIEALALGCPVVVSDIDVFHELLGDVPLYFDPKSEAELAGHLIRLLDTPMRSPAFTKKASAVAKRYSWKAMAVATHALYESRAL
jgi:glycosyltransferase involved in cell wall biosynthesis